MKQDPEVLRVPGVKEIGRSVPETILIEDGATDLCAVEMVIRVPVEGRDASSNQSIPQRSLPRRDFRPVNYPLLYPKNEAKEEATCVEGRGGDGRRVCRLRRVPHEARG
ncbi:hypothetical protein B296_00018265 [Ensete ventricosum]|uniref:Uncharacterized protein n=1 Tax=Ensete ventricosum TaxID=4639 RepID=A0A426YWV7_ENSVE|nr:hypothetical protein B296_00018265 [Ensete ventricosum]